MVAWTRFLLSAPSLRARQRDQMQHNQEMINAVLATRLGRSETDFEICAFSAAVLGVWTTTIIAWAESGAEDDLLPRCSTAASTTSRPGARSGPVTLRRPSGRPAAG